MDYSTTRTVDIWVSNEKIASLRDSAPDARLCRPGSADRFGSDRRSELATTAPIIVRAAHPRCRCVSADDLCFAREGGFGELSPPAACEDPPGAETVRIRRATDYPPTRSYPTSTDLPGGASSKFATDMFLAFAVLVLDTPPAWSLVDAGLSAVAAGAILFRNSRADPTWT